MQWLIKSLSGLLIVVVSAVSQGSELSEAAVNLQQYSDTMMTSGALTGDGLETLAQKGVSAIIDLRTEAEGVKDEQEQAGLAGIEYHNIPVGRELPSSEDIQRFKSLIESHNEALTLVHCASGNRVGTLWSMYRISEGVAADEALAEGRKMGMSEEREGAVKSWSQQ